MLSSINLSEYVKNPFTDNAKIDINTLLNDIPKIVEYMDDLLEEGLLYLPLEKQKVATRKRREIGIGCMGIADTLIKLGLKYGEEDANYYIYLTLRMIVNKVLESSALLAKERGSYPAYTKDVLKSEFIKNIADKNTLKLIEQYGLRNGQLMSIAPNGSISTLWGVSGGIEPIFALSHSRRSQSLGDGEDIVYKVFTKIVQDYMSFTGKSYNELPDYFITSHEIDYKKRIDFQSVVQKTIDNAISSTINLPNSTTVEDIENLFMYAWEKKLKGVTIYRDKCMRDGILSVIEEKKEEKQPEECAT